MSILRLVAGGAVERSFISLKLCSGKNDAVRLLQPVFDLHSLRACILGGFFQLSQTNPCERGVIHIGGARGSSTMFEMAGRAALDVRVKRGRLPLEQRSIVRVTDDAFASFDSGDWRVTRGAIVLQRCVRLREIAGTDHVLPEHGRENRTRCFLSMSRR